MYNSDTSLEEAYGNALKKDSTISIDEIPYLLGIPRWITYPMYVDYFTDIARKEFKAAFLTKEEHASLALDLNKNKLRRSLLENIDRFFLDKDMGYPSLVTNRELLSKWKSIRKIFTVNQPKQMSMYGKYDIEARIHYIDTVTQLIRTICIEYIKKHSV
jgi:hypothetical protein